MAKKKKSTKPEFPPLEESLGELSAIVDDLESGEQPIEDMMEQFERAMKLVKNCHERLDQQAQRIEIVVAMTAEGAETKPFETEARNEEVKRRASGTDDV